MRFQTILEQLSTRCVRFVVVGGVAVVLHGHSRVTADLDLVIDLEDENTTTAVKALIDLGFLPRLPVNALDFADRTKRQRWVYERNLQVFSFIHPDYPLLAVDLFAAPPISFEELSQRSSSYDLGGFQIALVSIDDLITMKRLAGRPQDEADIAKLLEIKGGSGV